MGNFIFLGPPGAGKGTMAAILTQECGYAHISTGDILRAEIKQGTELGRQVKQCIEGGHLVPDELVAEIVADRLAEPELAGKGLVLDGYPRTVPQAQLLEATLAKIGLELSAVVLFEVGQDLLLKRLTSRRVCSACRAVYNLVYGPPRQEGVCDACGGEVIQRADDSLETARERLEVYEEQTKPLIRYYQGKGLLVRVLANQDKDMNFLALREALKAKL